MDLAWKRPESSKYPQIWHTFTAAGEEYRIEDLPQSMTDQALKFMVENHCEDEPISAAYKLYEDEDNTDRFKAIWRSIIKQKTVLVCFKEGSDEIVGITMNCILCKGDYTFCAWIKFLVLNLYLEFRQLYRACIHRKYSLLKQYNTFKRANAVVDLLLEDVYPLEEYGVNEFLTAAGLCVARNYRGRGIGVQLLKTRILFCQQFNIKLILNPFTSSMADACAEKIGFHLEQKISYDWIREHHPHLKLPQEINSDALTLRSMWIT